MRPDDEAVVLSVEGTEHESRRLIDLGLVPGTPVRALRCAPLRDPIAFRFRDTTLCLRREQAKLVRVL
jgi:ferrous iron transport protein A